MAETMEAVVCNDFGEWSTESVPMPEPEPNEVVIQVHRVQLSVTECQRFHGKNINGSETVHEQMRKGNGRVFGHEFSGVVVDVGTNVTDISVGSRVYPPGKIPCRECAYCDAGYSEFCANRTSLGKGRTGALSEYIAAPASILRQLPDSISHAEGAAMQPLASATLCVHDAEIETGDTVAVIGTGVMGSHCGQLSLIQGAGDVYAVDIVDKKLDIASQNGMIPIDGRKRNPPDAVLKATDGIGADVVFVAVGGTQFSVTTGDGPLAQAYRTVRPGGKIVQVGQILGEVTVTPRDLWSKSIRWVYPRHGSVSIGPNTDTGALAAELVARNRIDIASYVTHELDGLNSFETAVDITVNKSEYGALGPAQIKIQ